MNLFCTVNRTVKICELFAYLNGQIDFCDLPESLVVCGRIIGILDYGEETGYILQDDSGKITIYDDKYPKAGDLIEQEITFDDKKRIVPVKKWCVLADCKDFYISSNLPNYKKIIIDENLRNKLILRSKVLNTIREFFLKHDFFETDTPCMVRLPGMEPYLDVFSTKFESNLGADKKISENMYLITSPEYAMKKLLVGGFEKIFQITKSFRNKETFSERHNPEFTILEWYRAYASYLEIMDDTEELIKFLWVNFGAKKSDGTPDLLRWNGKTVDVMSAWRKISVLQAFKEYADIDEETFFDKEKLYEEVKKRGYPCSRTTDYNDLFYIIFMNEIESVLGEGVPVILYDYPISMAALSKKSNVDGRFAERFELYIAGLEICNAFSELIDPVEQEKRLFAEKEQRKKLGKLLYDVDKTFIEALKFGMPPSGGNALGVDRLIMLLTGEKDISNVIYFPYRDL